MATARGLRWAARALLSICAVAHADPRPAVVELFTSEGCNSCPPAEAYVGELAGRNDVLALAFHVDYWDDLGWRDRFGLRQSVERQHAYARSLRLSSVYTPEVVIDGRADYVGSNRIGIGNALKERREGVPVTLSIGNGEADVRLAPGAHGSGEKALGENGTREAGPSEKAPGASGLGERAQGAKAQAEDEVGGDVVLVAYLRKAVSAIGRGENAGRTLDEYNIVRAIVPLGRWAGGAQEFRAKLASLPQDTTDLAVLVQSRGQGAVVGAATQRLR
jgi:hypothetical protein